MAVPHFKVSIHVLTDARYRAAGAAGRGLWLDGMAYCAIHRTDGFIPEAAVPDHKLAAKLVAVGLWQHVQDGWLDEGYLGQHGNTPKAKIEEKLQSNAESAARSRAAKAEAARHRSVIDDSSLLEARSQKLETRSQKPEAVLPVPPSVARLIRKADTSQKPTDPDAYLKWVEAQSHG